MRAVVVDDEQPGLARLKKLLQAYPDLDIVGEAHDGLEALSVIEAKKPDAVFLDIDMPELNGLEVAQTLGPGGPLIIFVTAYDQHAIAAFEANAIDYVVKPVNGDRLGKTIEKLRRSLGKEKAPLDSVLSQLRQEAHPRLAVKIGNKYEVFDPAAISVVLARDNYISLFVNDRELLADDSLEAVASRLNPNLFVRIHRSAVVNVKFLKELRREGDRKYTAVLFDKWQTCVPVSRERLPQLKRFLGVE